MNIDYMIDVADKTIELLSDPNNWTRVALARARGKQNSTPVHPHHPSANCFCIIGAIAKNSKLPQELSYDKWLEDQKSVINGLYKIDEVLVFAEFLARNKKQEFASPQCVYRFNDRAESNKEIVDILKEFREDLILQKSV